MKYQNLFLLVLAGSLSLTACDAGGSSSSTPPPPPLTWASYFNNSWALSVSDLDNCVSDLSNPNYYYFTDCTATTFSRVEYEISYNSSPASFVKIPNQESLPVGVTVSTVGICSESLVSNYSCTITVTSNGSTSSGDTVNIPIIGSLGTADFITVIYR